MQHPHWCLASDTNAVLQPSDQTQYLLRVTLHDVDRTLASPLILSMQPVLCCDQLSLKKIDHRSPYSVFVILSIRHTIFSLLKVQPSTKSYRFAPLR